MLQFMLLQAEIKTAVISMISIFYIPWEQKYILYISIVFIVK